MKCDQCTWAVINGVFCHERGCPNISKKWDPEEERWVAVWMCGECGEDVVEGDEHNHDEDESDDATLDDVIGFVLGIPKEGGEEVSLIASGYEWTCPNEDCETNNREIEITESVVCNGCGEAFKVSDHYHAHG